MKRISSLFNTIFAKFALAFIAVGLLPLGIMTYVVMGKIPEELEKYTVNYMEQMILYTGSNVEKKIADYDSSTQILYKNSTGIYGQLGQALRRVAESGAPTANDNTIFSSVSSAVLYSEQYIDRVFLLDEKGRLLNYMKKDNSPVRVNYDFAATQLYQTAIQNSKGLSIQSVHEETYLQKPKKKVISFARNYLDVDALPEKEIIRGTLIIDVDLEVFNMIFKRMSLDANNTIYILDSRGMCIYSRSPEDIGQQLDVDASWTEDSELAGRSYAKVADGYVFYHRIKGTDWMILSHMPRAGLINQILDINQFVQIMLWVGSLGLMGVSFVFSRSLTRPIKSVIRQMKQVESGNFDIKVKVSSHDEVRQLAETFNNMTSELKGYINKAYVAQIRQKEAELTAIKTQISPHYLYNTLEVIRMNALDEEAPTTSTMILALSEQLKYVIGYSDDIVPLGRELDNVVSYFDILKVRFEERFSLELEVPMELYDRMTLKLILQPIVENAVNHGLRPKSGKGKVMIKGVLKAEVLEIAVYDDGIGMDELKLKEIQTLLHSSLMGRKSDHGWESIGIKNVHDRIRLKYGPGYGLEITSRQNIGTIVKLILPCTQEGEDHVEDSISG